MFPVSDDGPNYYAPVFMLKDFWSSSCFMYAAGVRGKKAFDILFALW